MTIGSFTLIKNEAQWIAAHLSAWLPVFGQMVFFDGNSEDGTAEIIEHFSSKYPGRVKLFRGKDPANLEDDYVRLFNECLWSLDTDLACFLHPDMIPAKVPANFKHLEDCVAARMSMRSFAGEPGGQLYEIKGRGEAWKNIYRLRNPDLGAHYFGHYGNHHEDVYFSAITGKEHRNLAPFWDQYPYEVVDSGIEVLHYSDVRTHRRRYERMVRCLVNQGHKLSKAEEMARLHPRVTLKDSPDFKFVPAEYPADFLAAQQKYQSLRKDHALV